MKLIIHDLAKFHFGFLRIIINIIWDNVSAGQARQVKTRFHVTKL